MYKYYTRKLLFTTQSQLLVTLRKKKTFEIMVGKEESADNQHFGFSHDIFYPTKEKSKRD